MAQNARYRTVSRRSWLLAGLAIPLFKARAAETFAVTFDGDNLYPQASAVHFLTGKPLERLKGGNSVVFASQFTLFSDDRGTIFRQKQSRFIVSYSLWEETFKVTIPDPTPRSAEGLTMLQAEALCLDNIAISASGMAPDRPFWLKFELRTVRDKDFLALLGENSISIAAPLIDFFSKKKGDTGEHWEFPIGRLRLSDLPRLSGRRARYE